jgi:acyl-coenzyme A synthetase/AMP-(fatty) acid ligase/acyl carrier protein
MIAHAGIANLYDWYARTYGLGPGSRNLVVSSYAFDLTLKNLLATCMAGGTVVLAERALMAGDELWELLRRERITVLNCTPSHCADMIASAADTDRSLPDLRYLILGGEPIKLERFAAWFRANPQCLLIDSYGPTEITDVAVDGPLRTAHEEPNRIGRPIPGMRALVLDDALAQCPPLVQGELYLGGIGVARGYWNRPGLTAERFVPDPYTAGERLYRTGDLARAGLDGSLIYCGRADHQVKIRGHRVELGEIEAVLRAHAPQAADAVVALQAGGGTDEPVLVAYLVARDGDVPDASTLARSLRRSLPDYMVPQEFMLLDALPLTPSGKLDRNALALPGRARAAGTPPQRALDPVETDVIAIWRALLNRAEIGADDDFFDVGGHSLLAIRLLSRLKERFSITVPLRVVFEHTTPAALAAYIASARSAAAATPA